MPRCPTCHRRLAPGGSCPRDGAEAPPRSTVSEWSQPPEITGYNVLGPLGEGGFSKVWSARRLEDERPVAIKIAHASTMVARHRFAREAEALSAIGAPYVPRLFEYGVHFDGRPFLVMELIHDETLSSILEKRRDPPEVTWIREVADAVLVSLQAVHAQGLLHRDLKPENIFLDRSQPTCARLSDFGTVTQFRAADADTEPAAGAVVGTAEYMAPEQIAGSHELDRRTDIYAFGVLLYELLTLRVPFAGDRATIEKGHSALRPPRPSEFVNMPAALETLCLDCLAKDPAKRPPDVIAVRRALAVACRGFADTTIDVKPLVRPTTKLLSVTKQPVVLLAVKLRSIDRTATKVVTRRKGFVARQQGLQLLCGFSGLFDEKPEQAALAVARELVIQHGAQVTLHFAELTIRSSSGRRAPKLYGPAVQNLSSWMPKNAHPGVLLTEAMAQLLPEGKTRPADAHPGFRVLVGPGHGQSPDAVTEVPLFGREQALSWARESMHGSLRSKTPGLFTAFGGHGLGKSRFARALESLVRDSYPDAVIHRLRAPRRAVGRGNETHRALRRLIDAKEAALSDTGDDNLHVGDELRRAATVKPLVVIIDDAHYADDAALDAIEYATLDGPGVALWLALCAHPRLVRRRPQWGTRAYRYCHVELEPLPEDAAMKHAAELLRPAEFPPQAVLRQLAQWTGGNPQSLEQLVRTLKRRGLVRQRSQGGSWYVATAELARLPASPVGQWLAARQLDVLPPELAACVRVCAVLGQEFSRDELAWVQNEAERTGTASTTIDTDVGINSLAEQGIISCVLGDIWAFDRASFQDAIYKLVAKRDREHIHQSALAYWQAQAEEDDSDRVLASIARHAGAGSAREATADAYLELADRARRRHHHVDADLHYTAAIPHIEDEDHRRLARALGGRGKVRYRMQRVEESVEDLRRAQEHARALGDENLTARLILEEATALDWMSRFAESARRVEEAHALVEIPDSVGLEAHFLMSEGRSLHRSGKPEEAIERLEKATQLARVADEIETRIIGLLLLATLLAYTGRVDDAQARFDEVIELCRQVDDRFHLCVAYNNRAFLWSAKNSLANLQADLRRTIQLAREAGQPVAERSAAHNLAEYLYWSGQHDDAETLARRAYDLRRFLPEPTAIDALLLARILAATDRRREARAMVDEARQLASSGEPASDDLVICMLDLALDPNEDGTSRRWDELIDKAQAELPGEEFLELLYFRARATSAAGHSSLLVDIIRTARDRLADYPIWEGPFELLDQRAAAASNPD